jgi:hypothetical protein
MAACQILMLANEKINLKELGKSKVKHGFFTWKPSVFREGENHGLKPVE